MFDNCAIADFCSNKRRMPYIQRISMYSFDSIETHGCFFYLIPVENFNVFITEMTTIIIISNRMKIQRRNWIGVINRNVINAVQVSKQMNKVKRDVMLDLFANVVFIHNLWITKFSFGFCCGSRDCSRLAIHWTTIKANSYQDDAELLKRNFSER